jgi:hypothetical protein
MLLEQSAFETGWGPLTPKLTNAEEAPARYREAKADKLDLLKHDVPRLRSWRTFFEAEGIHDRQGITPDTTDRAKDAVKKVGRACNPALARSRGGRRRHGRRWRDTRRGGPPTPDPCLLGFAPVSQ